MAMRGRGDLGPRASLCPFRSRRRSGPSRYAIGARTLPGGPSGDLNAEAVDRGGLIDLSPMSEIVGPPLWCAQLLSLPVAER
jgi:hypothetical protein